MIANNSTNGSLSSSSSGNVIVGGTPVDGRSVEVEQGPRWLVEFAIDPPAWVLVVLVVIALIVIGLAALGYRRNGGLDQEILEEMGQIGTIVLSIMACAEVWTLTFEFGYVVDVLGGTVVGYAIAQYFIWAYYKTEERSRSVAKSRS